MMKTLTVRHDRVTMELTLVTVADGLRLSLAHGPTAIAGTITRADAERFATGILEALREEAGDKAGPGAKAGPKAKAASLTASKGATRPKPRASR